MNAVKKETGSCFFKLLQMGGCQGQVRLLAHLCPQRNLGHSTWKCYSSVIQCPFSLESVISRKITQQLPVCAEKDFYDKHLLRAY